MPCCNNRSTHAIAQQAQGKTHFISPQSDSASDGIPSSGDLSPPSDEDESAVCKLYNIPNNITKKQKAKTLKAPYTGDSHATKFCKQKHWKEAAKGCRKLNDFFTMSLICHLERTMGVAHQHCAQNDSEQLMDEDEMYLP